MPSIQEQGCPSYQCSHKLNLVLGKEKECQPYDAIKLHKGSYHDKAGCRNIFLYAIERCDDDAEERTIVVRIEKLQRILGIL